MAFRKLTLTAMGDSQTDHLEPMGVPAEQMWPENLAARLRAENIDIKARSFGIAGQTTTQMLARYDVMAMYDMPDVTVIYAGVNDGGTNTVVNLQAMIKAAKFAAYGLAGSGNGSSVASQTNLPAYGALGQRYVVMSDTSTAGGAAATHPSHKPTITGAGGSAQTVWEFRNTQAGEAGWGRVATVATTPWACEMIVVCTVNYFNWTTGGDDYNTATNTGTQVANNATTRANATTAVTNEAISNLNGNPCVVLADLYAFQSQLIYGAGATDTQGSNSWHAIANNQHHNAYGHDIVARCIYNAISSASWLKILNNSTN